MEPFIEVQSAVASFPEANIDTDVIFPARFLLLIEKSGLGRYAFFARRFDAQGVPNRDFVLNIRPFSKAQIAIAGDNFGCGSSREQAVWSLADFGIRCIIAPAFGEIFHANCFKNGILPIVLDPAAVERLRERAEHAEQFTVNLQNQTILLGGKAVQKFSVDQHRREVLLKGWDDIDLILNIDTDAINEFEQRQQVTAPWLYS